MDKPAQARLLGYGGLIPFVATLGVLLFADAYRDLALTALIAYGAVILTFVGAVHWGIALARTDTPPATLAISVGPSLIAWVALLLSPPQGLVTLLAAFVMLFAYERQALWATAFPGWYQTLRGHLTLGVVAVLAVATALVW